MTIRRFSMLIVLISSFFVAQAQNVTKDKEIGKEGYEMVKQQMGFYKFKPLEELVIGIGKKLEGQLENPLFDYEFYLVDSPEPNAFAIPGGKVFVTRGLLALPLSEDELAGVIGHEIIHANNRHGIKQQHGSIFGKIIAIPGVIIGGIFRGPIGTALASPFLMGNDLLQADYSRGHEKEADKEGTMLAAQAGYDPYDLAKILTRLSQEGELLSGQLEKESYFASHPYTPKRVKAITKYSKAYKQATPNPILPPNEFLKAFDGVMIGQNPEHGYVHEGTFYHPRHLFSFKLNNDWQTAITPTSFSLGNSKGDAIVSMVVDEDSLDYKEYLNSFEENMKNETQMTPENREEFTWYGYKGGVIEYDVVKNDQKITFKMIAVDYRDDKVMKISSLYTAEREKDVKTLLRNAKVIEEKDLPNTRVPIIKIVPALEGETFGELMKRTGSEEFALLQVVINEKSTSSRLKAGELIKIVSPKIYTF